MKLARQAEILKLIEKYDIDTQEELVEKLALHGFPTTQATISRDIRELKLTKIAGENGHVRYAVLEKNADDKNRKYISVLNEAVLSLEDAGNLLVIKTAPGMAMAAAAVLDDLSDLEIVGCIAGDNTIFVATKSPAACQDVRNKLKELLEP